jgi:acyl-CoA dehydrogenase
MTDSLLSRARAVAEVARQAAPDVDRNGVFPAEAVAALRAERLLACPEECLTASAMAEAVGAVAGACGSTGLIWAMHLTLYQVLRRHAPSSGLLADLLADVEEAQPLIAGATSEAGIGGDIRKSKVAVVGAEGVVEVKKRLETASYLQQADLILVTARRAEDATESDQVLVAATAAQSAVSTDAPWVALGMRGTESAAATICCRVPPDHVLPEPFADIVTGTLVPLSHVLWAACWHGIAADAVAVARRAVRRRGAQADDMTTATRLRLADVHARLSVLHSFVSHAACSFDAGRRNALSSSELKVQAGELAVEIVLGCLNVVGIRGYLEPEVSSSSLSRHVRDVLSSLVMVSNDRLRAANGWLALAPSLDSFE